MKTIKETLNDWSYKSGGLSNYFVFLFAVIVILLLLGWFEKYTKNKGFDLGYEAGYYQALRDYGIDYDEPEEY